MFLFIFHYFHFIKLFGLNSEGRKERERDEFRMKTSFQMKLLNVFYFPNEKINL